MVERVKKRRRDYFAIPAALFLWGSVFWLGYNLYQGIMLRRKIIDEINESTNICTKNPAKAIRMLNSARNKYWKSKNSPPERFFEMIELTFPDFRSQTASAYRSLGRVFVKRFEHEPLIRCYSMAMVHNPNQEHIAIDLGMSCMKTNNYELGYYTGFLANKDKAKSGNMYYKYFGKRYLPPWAKVDEF